MSPGSRTHAKGQKWKKLDWNPMITQPARRHHEQRGPRPVKKSSYGGAKGTGPHGALREGSGRADLKTTGDTSNAQRPSSDVDSSGESNRDIKVATTKKELHTGEEASAKLDGTAPAKPQGAGGRTYWYVVELPGIRNRPSRADCLPTRPHYSPRTSPTLTHQALSSLSSPPLYITWIRGQRV